MEIFGIPVILIILFIVWVLENKHNEKKEAARKWDSIAIGMDTNEVIRGIDLGKPHRVWKAGAAEIWGYGPNDSDGVIRFLNGKVIAFQKPD